MNPTRKADEVLIPLLQAHVDIMQKKPRLRLQPNYKAKSLTEAQKALYTDLMAIVGEDESPGYHWGRYAKRDELRAEIRTKLREYFNQEGDKT